MVKTILLEGCSFTYGLGLKKEETLEQHFIESGYEVINLSRPGKSNHAMALDIYKNLHRCDIVIVGWSFSSRWYLNYHGVDIDLQVGRQFMEVVDIIDADQIEHSYSELHKTVYNLFDSQHWNTTSDMLIDFTKTYIGNKSSVFYSWEHRNVKCPVYYPHMTSKHRLPDGHLNADGTRHLFERITAQLS